MELLLELLGAIIYGFFGALVGILYPPKSPSWARAQEFTVSLLCAAIVAWAAAGGAMIGGYRPQELAFSARPGGYRIYAACRASSPARSRNLRLAGTRALR
jgi:hypothetical protein